ncbi:MAG: ABC transporter permease [Alphaproteobacteria bacterium]
MSTATNVTQQSSKKITKIFGQYTGTLFGLFALCLFLAIANQNFLKPNNLMNIIEQVSYIAITAFGMTAVLIIGNIDLSVGSIMGLAGTVMALALQMSIPAPISLLLAVGVGILCGSFNGFLTAFLSIPAFIVTLATMGIFRGIIYSLTKGRSVPIDNDFILSIGMGRFLGVPISVWLLLIFAIIAYFFLQHLKWGRRAYIMGGNYEAARHVGINVKNMTLQVFIFAGFMASIGGIIATSRVWSAQPNLGIAWELDAIAAAVLGGTSLTGGKGRILGTLIGALIIGVINNGMNLLSVEAYYQPIVKGFVILLAVWVDVKSQANKRH